MKVVLDTNVLVAALRSQQGAAFQVLRALRERRFAFALTVPLFLEYEDVLKRPGLVPLTADAIERFLLLVAARGAHHDVYFLWRPFLRDDKDDMVLEAAVAAGCAAIVTFNLKDFGGVEQFNLGVWTPAQFLEQLELR